MKNNRPADAQIVYFYHGGEPLPILGDNSHRVMVDFMRQLPAQLDIPETILAISVHWEEPKVQTVDC